VGGNGISLEVAMETGSLPSPDGGAPPHRFSPRMRNARAETFVVGLVAAVLCYLLVTFRGMERGEATWISVAVGLVAYGLYAFRIRLRGLQSVEIADETLSVTDRAGTRVVRWDEVVDARHTYYGGDRWVIRSRDGRPGLNLLLDGYPPEEAARINRLIRERLPEGDASGGRA